MEILHYASLLNTSTDATVHNLGWVTCRAMALLSLWFTPAAPDPIQKLPSYPIPPS